MTTFGDRIKLDSFSIENIDISEIEEVSEWLPENGVMDINIAEQGLVFTLHAQNNCQQLIAKIDRWISIKDGDKNRAWAHAALVKAGESGLKGVKNCEWFAQADDDYIEACNQLAIAKAAKKWMDNKAKNFEHWHYAFKTFLKRDYGLERLGNFQQGGGNGGMNPGGPRTGSNADDDGEDTWGEESEVEWTENK